MVETAIRKTAPGAYTIHTRRTITPEQLDLFADDYKRQWFKYMLVIAEKMKGQFSFNDLRAECKVQPGHPNWFGSLTRKMKAAGFTAVGIQKSQRGTRRGGYECVWEKRV